MSAGEEEAVAVTASRVAVKEMNGEMTAGGVPAVEKDAVLESDAGLRDVAWGAETEDGEVSVEDEEATTEDENSLKDEVEFGEEEDDDNSFSDDEDELMTRFGSSVHHQTDIENEATFLDEDRHNNNDYHKLLKDMAISYKDVDLIDEYEMIIRKKPIREMSVIVEEEGEEWEEEPLSQGAVVQFADELAAWVLQDACLEVGRAWEKVTSAWEEMTYTELVQRREGKHHRQLYKAISMPPENELMKGSERQLSEAELRVRRSLQRLDVPDWMKNAPPPQQGFLLRRRDYGSSSAPAGGWSAYSSKTASMTSLGSSRAVTPNTPTKVVIPTRVATRGAGGLGGITSPASNCSISPSPSDRSGSLFQYPISRWSTSRLNSGTTTPTGSVTSARTTATYTRQPYLGWRSQTSLSNLAGSQSSLTSTGSYLTAADRLALGITAYSQRFVKPTPSTQDKENSSSEANAAAPKRENPEQNDTGSTNGSIKLQVPTDVADVHSSIKEVTSAIVHYCNETTPSPRASPRGSPRPDGRAPSPRRLVWVESSFVGSRPITSPETPTSSTHAITPTSQLNGHDLPESGEVTSRPPQPPGEYLLGM